MHRTPLIRAAVAGAAALGAGAALAAATGTLPAQAAPERGGWSSVGTGMTSGVSGMALTGRHGDGYGALIVRDNKKPGENRLARVAYRPGGKPAVQPLKWRGGSTPVDLESIDKVPGRSHTYVAVASAGRGHLFDVRGRTAHVRGSFPLPDAKKGANFEDFAMTARHGRLTAVWGDRGQDDRPATLYAAPLDVGKDGRARFGAVAHAPLHAPYPSKDVRHASDLKITDRGRLLVSSASDPGDDGPFDSAVYDAGRVTPAQPGGTSGKSGRASLHLAKDPEVLGKFAKHKIEAIGCLHGQRRGLLGTDDENAGGALKAADVCQG